jgi:NADPH2:quinone reductase
MGATRRLSAAADLLVPIHPGFAFATGATVPFHIVQNGKDLVMRALRFYEFGSPDVLRSEIVAAPQPDADHAIVAVHAASVNPSDVANVAGRFPATVLPRTPGRDYAGIVVDGPAEWMDAEVWGTGDAGFAVDGSHAELIRVPIASLRRKPTTLTHAEAASIGVNFAAAWLGVAGYAALRPGETLVVIGASGGVGGAAVQIGRRIGARVIGIDRSAPRDDAPATKMAERIVTPPPAEAAAMIRDLTKGRGADVVLNTVGGATFEPSLAMLAHRGRLAVLASPGQPRQTFDLLDFYHNESQLFGVDTLKRDMVASAALLDGVAPGFEDGSYLPPIIAESFALDDAAQAYRSVAAGTRGRVVITPGHI